MKIEQQEISTKHIKSKVQISSNELYILNKVKEAKINSSKVKIVTQLSLRYDIIISRV